MVANGFRLTVALAIFALVPAPACAQDASVLVVVGGPPLVLTPFIAALLRRAWLRRTPHGVASWSRFLALSALDLVLWLAVAWLATLVSFQEGWLAGIPLYGVLVAILAVHRYLTGGTGSWMLWLGSALVFPAVCFVLLLISWAMLVALG